MHPVFCIFFVVAFRLEYEFLENIIVACNDAEDKPMRLMWGK